MTPIAGGECPANYRRGFIIADRYEVVAEIATTTNSQVFRAVDRRNGNEHVALKVEAP
jgi:hypothetical protein